jgi:hypothetical protein
MRCFFIAVLLLAPGGPPTGHLHSSSVLRRMADEMERLAGSPYDRVDQIAAIDDGSRLFVLLVRPRTVSELLLQHHRNLAAQGSHSHCVWG